MARFAERIGLRDAAERGAFAGAVAALAIVLLVGLFFGLKRSDRELGSNAVGVGAPVAGVKAGKPLCLRSTHVPSGTERLRMWLATPRGGDFDIVFVGPGGKRAVAANQKAEVVGYQFVDAPKTAWPVGETQQICVETGGNGYVQVGGAALARYPGQPAATLGGTPLGINEPAVHYYSGASDQPRQLSKVVSVFAHSSTYHGPLFPWVMLLSLLFALFSTGLLLRTVITADRHAVKRIAWIATLACFAWCLAWSVMSPPFQGNDESEHFANVEYIAANNGKMWSLSATKNANQIYSDHEQLFMSAVHHNALVVDGTARPIWSESYAPTLGTKTDGADRGDGGGVSAAGTGHGPLYYLAFAPFYKLTTWMQPANQLVFLRALNSIGAAFVAFFAVLAAGLLLGEKRRRAAATAGALIAFQPMFAYVSGAINNDTWVNVAGAAILVLLLKLARDGWKTRRDVSIGLVAVFGVIGKGTGAASAVAAGIAVGLTVLRDRSREAVLGGARVLGTVIASCAAWLLFAKAVGWTPLLAYRHTDELPLPPQWIPTLPQKIDYTIQQILPFIHLTGPMVQVSHAFERVYIVGGFGDFFWHRVAFTIPTFKVILAVLLAVFITGAIGFLRHHRWVLKNWLEVTVVLLQPIAVYTFVEFAYATPGGRAVMAEQGRYIFPALGALAVIGAAALFGLPKKLRDAGWGALSGTIGAFAIVAWTFAAFHVYA